MRSVASRIGGKQADDLICQLGLFSDPICLRKSVECTAEHVGDVPGQGGVRFSGVELLLDDADGVGIETEKPRLQAGCDKALVEPKGKVIVVVGHPETRTRLLEGDPPEQ